MKDVIIYHSETECKFRAATMSSKYKYSTSLIIVFSKIQQQRKFLTLHYTMLVHFKISRLNNMKDTQFHQVQICLIKKQNKHTRTHNNSVSLTVQFTYIAAEEKRKNYYKLREGRKCLAVVSQLKDPSTRQKRLKKVRKYEENRYAFQDSRFSLPPRLDRLWKLPGNRHLELNPAPPEYRSSASPLH